MPITIKVNGTTLSLVHKMSNGISTATIPDVCKTPSPGGPVPMPYPNIAQSVTLSNGTTTVKGDRMMTANKGSKFALSNGDNAGVAGGVKSNTFMKEATWISYAFTVKLQGKGAARFTDKMFHNSQNTVNLSGAINPPISVAEFEDILKDCVNKATADWNSANGGKPPDAAWCAKGNNARNRGKKIGDDAAACVQDAMTKRGNGNEVSVDQSFTRKGGGLKKVGRPGEVHPNTVRPDVVFHGPFKDGAKAFPKVRGVYDFKAPCPPSTNSPQWTGAQGADYLSMFGVVPKLVSPGNIIVTGALAAARGGSGLALSAKLLRAAAKMMKIPIPFP